MREERSKARVEENESEVGDGIGRFRARNSRVQEDRERVGIGRRDSRVRRGLGFL